MITKPEISDSLVEFLCADEGEPPFANTTAIEFFGAEGAKPEESEAAVAILRCLDDPQSFLICSFTDIRKIERPGGKADFAFTPEPVETLLDFIDCTPDDVPVFDRAHIGPLSMERAMQFLELLHAKFALQQAFVQAESLKARFTRAAAPWEPSSSPAYAKPAKPEKPDYSVEEADGARIIRPARWLRAPEPGSP